MKKVLITGVSKGIGKALSLHFLEKGFFVVGVGKNRPDYSHKNFVFFENDFENYKEIKIDFSFDIVVLNSGITIYKRLKDIEQYDVERVFKVNLFGNLLTLKSIAKNLKQNAVVSFISSIAALEKNNFEFWGLYSSSKTAMEKALMIFAKEEKFKLLLFNLGRVDTDIWKEVSGKERYLSRISLKDTASLIEKEMEKALSKKTFSFKRVVIEQAQ